MSDERESFAEMPPEVELAIQRLSTEDRLQRLRTVEEHNDAHERIAETYRNGLRELADNRLWDLYERLHRRRVEMISGLREQLDGSVGAAERLLEARRSAIKKSLELFAEAGVDTEELKRLQLEQREALERLPLFADDQPIQGDESHEERQRSNRRPSQRKEN